MLLMVSLRLLLMGSVIGAISQGSEWKCPPLDQMKISCSCDFPQTLRCTTDLTYIKTITRKLQNLASEETISLLDCTIQNITYLPGPLFKGVSLHGLVLTSGELRNISKNAFVGLLQPLQALGLPNNKLKTFPTEAFKVLPKLERLDMSYNKITHLDFQSFEHLDGLKFLDLNNNQIANVTSDAFSNLKRLKVLKLKGNRMRVSTVSALTKLDGLEELDLSTNSLAGPLESNTMTSMPLLKILSLANNQFSSICQGALRGAFSLISLSLNHNQIDVLEDHAFRELPSLRILDLGSNRIVAISGSSLAHLTQLTELDLSHNFLRALTADIVTPLTNLRVLRLDDNDISMVETDTFRQKTSLERLTLSDNPLNCDCNLVDFVVWFNNASRLSLTDRSTAVCMTPPHLENALLIEVPPNEMRCEEDNYDLMMQEGPSAKHVSEARIVLRAFNFDGSSVTLLWSIDSKAKSFSCDALFIYEELTVHEVLQTSTPLRCNSSQMVDPTTLVVRLDVGSMQPFHRYRFCVVLLEDKKNTDEMQLVLGCSEVIPLIVTNHSVPQYPPANPHTKIISLQGSMSLNTLTVSVELTSQKKLTDAACHISVTVFLTGSLLAQHLLNCTDPKVSLSGLPRGSYHVCASLEHYFSEKIFKCITVDEQIKPDGTVWLIVCFILLSTLLFLALYFLYRKIIGRAKLKTTHQYFLAANEFDDRQKQHSRDEVRTLSTRDPTTDGHGEKHPITAIEPIKYVRKAEPDKNRYNLLILPFEE